LLQTYQNNIPDEPGELFRDVKLEHSAESVQEEDHNVAESSTYDGYRSGSHVHKQSI